MDMESKRVVITGGAGFIGSFTAEKFGARGHQVTILDNLSTGTTANLRTSWRLFEADICDRDAVDAALLNADIVVHLAAFTSVPESFERFQECNRVNVEGTYNVLESCVGRGVGKLVFASSSALYSALPDAPKSEDDRPEPNSPYGASKLEGEHLLHIFHSHHKLPSVALRFFNVFGPRQPADGDYASVIPAFIQRSLAGQPLIIYGDGHQSRDFVFIDDVTEAIYGSATSGSTGILNVGTGTALEVLDIADAVSEVAGRAFEYTYLPERPGDVQSCTANIERIKAAFNWKPAHSFAQGLRDTFNWYSERAEAQPA
jgi:UDP-glucose 4-epimerase